MEIPTTHWTDVSLDFVEGLPKSQRYEVILVVVDRLTKYSHFIPISHPYSAAKLASLYMHYVLKLHGLPVSIVSDKDAHPLHCFGLNSLGCKGLIWPCPLLTILKVMVKQKL